MLVWNGSAPRRVLLFILVARINDCRGEGVLAHMCTYEKSTYTTYDSHQVGQQISIEPFRKYITKQLRQKVCKQSDIVYGSRKYPLQREQIKC